MRRQAARRLPAGFPVVLVFMISVLFTRPAFAEESYTVQPGDTLARIARTYGVDLDVLATANNLLNPNLIYPGQVLVIPGAATPPAAKEAVPPAADGGDSLPAPAIQEHVVQPGENLYRVALHYGVTASDLQQLNSLPNANLIYAGQRLLVPQNGAAIAGSAAPPPAPVAAKRIVVDKSEQRAYVYENGALLWTFVVSTGMPGSETWSGAFHVRSKIPEAYAYNWALRMPYWLGFYHTGYLENGFHALPIMSSGAILWDGYLGTPVSYGCVILSYPDATTLYNWAEIGTEVIVQP